MSGHRKQAKQRIPTCPAPFAVTRAHYCQTLRGLFHLHLLVGRGTPHPAVGHMDTNTDAIQQTGPYHRMKLQVLVKEWNTKHSLESKAALGAR